MTASFLLPTYNEGGHIVALIHSLRKNIPECQEILVVDDASPDGTADRVEALNDPTVRVIRRKERGLVSALQTGVDLSRGDLVAWMDADFSHPPEVARQLTRLVSGGACEVAVATRYRTGGRAVTGLHTPLKIRVQQRASRTANQALQRILNPACSDWTSGFVAVTSERIKPLRLQGFYGDYFIRLMGEWIAEKAVIQEVPYESPPRRSGDSKTATSWPNLAKMVFYYAQSIHQTRRLLRASFDDQ